MASGKVKWFNNAKGYGFIVPADGGEDLFAHFSAVAMDGYKTLIAGQQVQFEITQGDKGPQATNIITTDVAPRPAADTSTESSTEPLIDSSTKDRSTRESATGESTVEESSNVAATAGMSDPAD
jgi:CspA family cold shock protein